MKKKIIFRHVSILLTICTFINMMLPMFVSEAAAETKSSEEVFSPEFNRLNDPALLQYVEDEVYSGLSDEFQSEDYIIENVQAIYYSKEYLEELDYNSKENIWFGYTLSELLDQFEGKKFVFTLGKDNTTIVTEFADYDDTYEKVIRNVAIGSGVILVCVTVSVVTAGAGAVPISMIFAASAKTGTVMALSSGGISAVAAGTITGIQTGDFDQAVKAGALAGSESFKWGAIAGAISGGVSEVSNLRKVAVHAEDIVLDTPIDDVLNTPIDDILDTPIDDVLDTPIDDVLETPLDEIVDTVYIDNPDFPAWKNAELRALSKYGGSKQVTYLDGVEVPFGTPGATRPDVVTTVGDHIEAIEVKYYNLESPSCLNKMYSELEREISARVANLPPDATQRVVLDVTGRDFSKDLVMEVSDNVQAILFDIYPDIPVDIVGL